MRKLRVLAVMHRELMPETDPSKYHVDVDWKMEYDVVETLENLGHHVHRLGLRSNIFELTRAVQEIRPEIVFNLLEDFDDVPAKDASFAGMLDLLRIPFTGCGPRGLLLARDKGLSKRIVRDHGIRVPEFRLFARGQMPSKLPGDFFPAIVKSLTRDGSIGISQASVVATDDALARRVEMIWELAGSAAIAEQYITGREFYVGVIGNQRLTSFPVWELRFNKQPTTTRLIATDRVKWSDSYQKRVGVWSGPAALAHRTTRELRRLARRIYEILGMTGYGRMDFRMSDTGEIFFLEANPNPQLAYGEDFAESAEKGGLSYEALVARIMRLGLERPRE